MSAWDEPSLILNLGGEGEFVGAIDINNLIVPMRRPPTWIRPGRFIRGDMTHCQCDQASRSKCRETSCR